MEINKIYQMDAIEFLKQVSDKSIDFVLIDPPYGDIRIDKKIDLNYKTKEEYLQIMKDNLIEIKRILKDTGTIALQCDQKSNYKIRLIMDEVFGENNFVNEILPYPKG